MLGCHQAARLFDIPVLSVHGAGFIAHGIRNTHIELRQRAKGIVQGFWRLYTDDFYDIRMPVPPVAEQHAIMDRLNIDLSGINTAISRLDREIDFLREYRTRLVADVVTGKLDVRAAAARLPQVAEPVDNEPDVLVEDEEAEDLNEIEH